MVTLTDDLRRALTAGRLAHLATINPDGSPQVSAVWIGLDGGDIVIGHLGDTLRELSVGEEQISRVADIANSVRDDVLNRTPQTIG